ncbi:MAG: ankyrin repeat domain-containing protein, partial [Planctomycetaceae bacterium]|nr:ankyrin repeat domain-containing protein [Planctomycetaceae bacterium]
MKIKLPIDSYIFSALFFLILTLIVCDLSIAQSTTSSKSDRDRVSANEDQKGDTPLHRAVAQGKLDDVKILIDEKKIDVNIKNKIDIIPLHYAVSRGDLEIVKYLIDKDADVNAKDQNDNTPLIIAAIKGHLEVVKYLIDKDAD